MTFTDTVAWSLGVGFILFAILLLVVLLLPGNEEE